MTLEVFEAAAKAFAKSDKPIISVFVDKLAELTKSCDDAEVFESTKFEIVPNAGAKADSIGAIHLSPWQLVNDQNELKRIAEECATLVADVVASSVREQTFRKRISKAFPELK